ncbi:MAG: hypothetical protein M0P19_14375, partial [Nevskia sp.]|nr:hypothetical protein [Nevskia sp.]
LERLVRAFAARGCETSVTGLKDDYKGLIDELHNVKVADVPPRSNGQALSYALSSIGENIVSVGGSFAAIVNMLGALILLPSLLSFFLRVKRAP